MIFRKKRCDVTLSWKEYNAALNQAMMRGYELGYAKGKEDMLFNRCTPNEIREILGLEAIKERYK